MSITYGLKRVLLTSLPYLLLNGFFSLSYTCAQDKNEGFNNELGFPLWIDNSLWDDQASFTARRLNLTGQANELSSFYRSSPLGKINSFSAPLYAIDLYAEQGKLQKVVLGFINVADLSVITPLGSSSEFSEKSQKDYNVIRSILIKRLGSSSSRSLSEVWFWLDHEFLLTRGNSNLTLTIQKISTATTKDYEKALSLNSSRLPPTSYLKRSGTGDIYISGLPPISQGNRNFCVPATWEKILRHYGLRLNVYDLAEQGGSKAEGTYFFPFAKKMETLLRPSRYKVIYISPKNKDTERAAIYSYLDQGLPIIWGLDASNLPYWIERNPTRINQLPPSSQSLPPLPPAYHALLIVGYNKNYREYALSDSTELGSSKSHFWIKESEMNEFTVGEPKIVVIPPDLNKNPTNGFLVPKWY